MMDEGTIRVAIRATARISFVLFLGAFLGDALYRLMPAAATRWLKANKDGLTLGFAGSHTVHLALILTLMAEIGRDNVLKRVMPVTFTVGFLFIYALAAGVLLHHYPVWSSRFEALAHYYLIGLFTFSFTRHAIKEPAFYVPFALIAFLAIAVRIAAAIRSQRVPAVPASV